MRDWRQYLARAREWATKQPKLLWAAAAVILVSLTAVLWLELSGPPYAVLSEGLSPADGGKVIAQLQKLGIPYQLKAAGNIILVPAPQLAQARLQLAQAQVPGSDAQTAWSKLENAPMTASDLAQSTMALQALQLSLQQSIDSMEGIRDAQVFLAIPPETPFLADQPKPTASVVIDADTVTAQAQGEAIANLVAGAVPGLAASNVNVETMSGSTVFPPSGALAAGARLATQAQVEAEAIGRIAGLLTPLVGAGNFQANVSANLDFTQEHIHQIAYGPGHLVTHQKTSQSTQYGTPGAVLGIPGALSNEPPSPTTASANAAPTPATAGGASATQGGNVVAEQTKPTQNSTDTDQSYVTDQSENDITKPDWSVNSIAVSVVLNKAALHNAATAEQVKAAITGAFAYPNVSVNVLEASFQTSGAGLAGAPLAGAINPLARALLEVMAAAALLFGLALPLGRQLKASNMQALLPQTFQRPIAVVRPARDFTELRDQVSANIPGVARLLQNWVEDNE